MNRQAFLDRLRDGLSGMRHRVESAGGRLSITSRPGKGTLVAAVMPLGRNLVEAPEALAPMG